MMKTRERNKRKLKYLILDKTLYHYKRRYITGKLFPLNKREGHASAIRTFLTN